MVVKTINTIVQKRIINNAIRANNEIRANTDPNLTEIPTINRTRDEVTFIRDIKEPFKQVLDRKLALHPYKGGVINDNASKIDEQFANKAKTKFDIINTFIKNLPKTELKQANKKVETMKILVQKEIINDIIKTINENSDTKIPTITRTSDEIDFIENTEESFKKVVQYLSLEND